MKMRYVLHSRLKADGTVMDDVFVDDGLHLTDKGNRIWAVAIKSVLTEIEAELEEAAAASSARVGHKEGLCA